MVQYCNIVMFPKNTPSTFLLFAVLSLFNKFVWIALFNIFLWPGSFVGSDGKIEKKVGEGGGRGGGVLSKY